MAQRRKASPFFDQLEHAVKDKMIKLKCLEVPVLELVLPNWSSKPMVEACNLPPINNSVTDKIEFNDIQVVLVYSKGKAVPTPGTRNVFQFNSPIYQNLKAEQISGPRRNTRKLKLDEKRIHDNPSLDELFFQALKDLAEIPNLWADYNLTATAVFSVTVQCYSSGGSYQGFIGSTFNVYVRLIRHWSEQTLESNVLLPLNDQLLLAKMTAVMQDEKKRKRESIETNQEVKRLKKE